MSLPQQPVRLTADRLRLAQVLANLLSNAAKYTDKGGRIELTVDVHEAELAVRVRDNGIGLTPECRIEVSSAGLGQGCEFCVMLPQTQD